MLIRSTSRSSINISTSTNISSNRNISPLLPRPYHPLSINHSNISIHRISCHHPQSQPLHIHQSPVRRLHRVLGLGLGRVPTPAIHPVHHIKLPPALHQVAISPPYRFRIRIIQDTNSLSQQSKVTTRMTIRCCTSHTSSRSRSSLSNRKGHLTAPQHTSLTSKAHLDRSYTISQVEKSPSRR